jgi:predicted Zn-dependent protease
VFLKQGELPQLQNAFQALHRSVDLDPTITDAQIKLGEFYVLAKKFDEAQERANLVLQSDPNHSEAHTMLGVSAAAPPHMWKELGQRRARCAMLPRSRGSW